MDKATHFYDSARILFQQKTTLTDGNFIRLARDLYMPFNLFLTNTTFNQMKTSGSLRYIKNTELASELSSYYDQWVPRLLTYFDYINEKLHSEIEPFFAQHFDLTISHYYFSYDSFPSHLRYYERTEATDILIRNYFQLYFNGVTAKERGAIKTASDKAIEAIKLLQKEYHLKDK